MTEPHVLGVDGGNSKTDVALVASDGRLLAAIRGGTISHQQVGLEELAARCDKSCSCYKPCPVNQTLQTRLRKALW